MRHAKFLDQALQPLRLFQRIQVFALHILDERHGGGGLVRHVAHQHRDRIQPGQPGGTETAFASDDFILTRVRAGSQAANQDRLHDALRLDALSQFVQGALVHTGARLVLTGHHVVQRQCAGHAGIGNRLFCRGTVLDLGA